jgi:hypothetical protein
MDTDKDRTKVDASPESTWGATEEAKTKWQNKHGKAAEKAAAERQDEKKD